MTATMAETHRGQTAWMGAVARAMWPWGLLFIVGKPLLELRQPPYEWSASSLRWAWGVTEDAALALPFLIFAGGVALVGVLGHSRRLVRTAVGCRYLSGGGFIRPGRLGGTGSTQSLSGRPGLRDRGFATVRAKNPDRHPGESAFRGGKPSRGIHPERKCSPAVPPNVLRWELYRRPAIAAFAVVNVFLGVLAAILTLDFSRRAQRNARLAIGVFGGIAFFACLAAASPVEPFVRDGIMRSGVLGAWAPLVFPLAQAFALVCMVRRREGRRPEHGRPNPSGDDRCESRNEAVRRSR